MATLPSLLQPKTLPIKADPMGPAMPTDVEKAQSRVSDIERQLGIKRGEQAEFQAQKGMMEAGQAVKRAEKTAEATRAEREAIETSEPFMKAEDVEREMMGAYFQPTQRSAQESAALFSLINVLGFFIGRGGKQSATQALAAMNGMLEGKQAGDAQRFKEEKIKFDTNLCSLNQKYTMLTSQLKKVADLAARDKQAAAQELDVVLAQEQADFLKTHINKVGLAKTIAELEGAQKGSQRALDIATQNERRAEEKRRQAEEAMERERFRRETQVMLKGMAPSAKPEIFQDPKTGKLYSVDPVTGTTEIPTPEGMQLISTRGRQTATAGGGGAVQFRYNAAMTNAGNALSMELENAASLPLSATPPAAAEVLTNPAKGLTDAARSFFAQKITSEEARAMQQTFAGMQRAITTIEASGRPSGATEGAIKEFGKTMPRAGDNRINTYLFLAQAKQVMEILVKDLKASGGSPEQIAQAESARDRVGKTINWNVKDINDILAKGGRRLVDPQVQKSIEQSENLKQFERNVKAKEKAEEANGPYADVEKERRYQEWKARQGL